MQTEGDEMKRLLHRFDDLERAVRRLEDRQITFWGVFWAVIVAAIALGLVRLAVGMLNM